MSATLDGKRVSSQWRTVLQFARDSGVDFRVNSGKRTMAEQMALYRAMQNGSGVLAAYPSPTAPHIRVGRADHALDVQQDGTGGRAELQAWLSHRGLKTSLTVPGENWHMEAVSLTALLLMAWRIDSLLLHRRRLASRRIKRGKAKKGTAAYRRYDRLVNSSLDSIALRKQQLHL